ncbi:MAG: hypothetical protein V3S29_14275, partial [bacterium]
MSEIELFVAEIESYCRRLGMAESTFGLKAVNDGKFVNRLRSGKRVTTATIEKAREAMKTSGAAAPGGAAEAAEGAGRPPKRPRRGPAAEKEKPSGATEGGGGAFRFYDNRQKYLMFVHTCSEKWVVAERVGKELAQIQPSPPALRLFDAGLGDGSVLARTMRQMHRRFPTVPFYVVGKEISLEDVRLTLEKMPDRFVEHPAMVVVITNLYYSEAPWLMPRSVTAAASLNWRSVALTGATAHDFEVQINELQPLLSDGWRVRTGSKTGNPLYVRPSVLVLYRDDHKLLLDRIIPRPGQEQGNYDLV